MAIYDLIIYGRISIAIARQKQKTEGRVSFVMDRNEEEHHNKRQQRRALAVPRGPFSTDSTLGKVRVRALGENRLGDHAAEGEHGEAAVHNLVELVLLRGLLVRAVAHWVEAEVSRSAP